MQLLSVGTARSVWLFDLNELNPGGKSIFPDILTWLGAKYSFQKFPRSLADIDADKKGWLFVAGEFKTSQDSITVNLSLFNDGAVADTWASTEQADAFLEDVLQSATARYGLPFTSQMVRTRQYVSEVTCRLDYPLSNLNKKMLEFCDSLSVLFKRHNLPPFEPYGLGFSPDVSASTYKPPAFLVERKLGAPYGENKYWSKSPLPTKEHLHMLGEFEKLLSACV